MDKIKKIFKENIISIAITVISVIFILCLDFLGIFQSLELKTLDYAFGVRGPTSGVIGENNKNIDKSDTDIVLIDLDDESYRLIPWTYPFPRGEVWAKIIDNLSLAGAKVIVIDIMFDASDQSSDILSNYGMNLGIAFQLIDDTFDYQPSLNSSIKKNSQ